MFNQADKTQALNILNAVKRGKYELQGEEVLAFAQMLQWFGGLIKKIDLDIESTNIQAAQTAVLTPIVEETKQPIKSKNKKK